MAPVTERRGHKAWGHGRLPGPTCWRHTGVAWAAASTRHACWARADDPQPRDQGASQPAAVRALACPWSRMLFRCWHHRTRDEEALSLKALKRRGAPLLHRLAPGSGKNRSRPVTVPLRACVQRGRPAAAYSGTALWLTFLLTPWVPLLSP